MYCKLSDYAKKFHCTYRTAWNRYRSGKIDGAFIDETGHVIIPLEQIDSNKTKKAAIYTRVSNNDAKENLERQNERVTNYAVNNGYNVTYSIKEIGSGLNDSRKKLINLLSKSDWDVIIVEHKDRLTRFGFNYLKTLLELNNKSIIVINNVENNKQDLMQDFISILYSFSARIYGMRKARMKKNEILEILK